MTDRRVYVSITGLRLRKPWHFLRFHWHVMSCLKQAKKARGNLRAEVKTINGVRHTLTVWEDENAMRDFLYSDAHKHAVAACGSIATVKTFGFETDQIPSWNDVHDLWRERGWAFGS